MTLSEPGALVGAAAWIEGLMTGGLAVGLATIGVVGIGFAMLTGRLQIRRGIGAVFGCFLILGAPAMARGIMGLAVPQGSAPPAPADPPSASLAPVEAKKVQTVDDPYAGASLVRH